MKEISILMNQYMVEIDLPEVLNASFMAKIPAQRDCINDLMYEGRIVNYALAMDRGKLWLTAVAKDEQDIMDMLATFPLINYMKPSIHELLFQQHAHEMIMHISLN